VDRYTDRLFAVLSGNGEDGGGGGEEVATIHLISLELEHIPPGPQYFWCFRSITKEIGTLE
jgi:hypothetical protein